MLKTATMAVIDIKIVYVGNNNLIYLDCSF